MTRVDETPPDSYVLERSGRELDRLDLQGQIYHELTRASLVAGGVKPGMRVLDIGCGSGDVSRVAAQLVGRDGAVVGIDLDQDTVRSARERTHAAGIANTSFEVTDASQVSERGTFDALVGRFVLMHQPHPERVLAQACRALRDEGRVVMLESNMASLLDGIHSSPHLPSYDEVVRWKCAVVAKAADINAGMHLHGTLSPPGYQRLSCTLRHHSAAARSHRSTGYMAQSVRSMLPIAQEHQIAGFDAGRVDVLEETLRAQALNEGAVVACWPVVTAWSQISR
jgi:ubiquinone/menaquinone biosynthesis C-methylase UbiE